MELRHKLAWWLMAVGVVIMLLTGTFYTREVVDRKDNEIRKLIMSDRDAWRLLGPAMFIVSIPEGKIIQWSTRAAMLFGYTHGEMIGQSIDIFIPENFRQQHRQAWEKYCQNVVKGTQDKRQFVVLCEARTKSGRSIKVVVDLHEAAMPGQPRVPIIVSTVSLADEVDFISTEDKKIFRRATEYRRPD